MSDLGVSIITCTNNPDFLMNIFNNYQKQIYTKKELIIIINKDSISLKEWKKKAANYPNVSVYKVAERVSLGQCLNSGISKAKYPLIAKFDNDDFYSPYYLREQVKALLRTGSSVVGKHACLVYLSASKKLVIRSPFEKNKTVDFIQGGTILFRKKILKNVRFSNLTVGEDVKFLKDCSKKGYRIYATTPTNYVYIRRKNKSTHTWQVNDNEFLHGGKPVAVTTNFRQYAVRKF
ncbi:MAG: glycosyltransferase family 2 protein [Candidatus Pristimantibacillus lignocellulolyticus]|uniref:Glycosyltransferase family 2 protein n=1 Tax=Candidatus Pristimantibacillus lignocellulolyticus TaxID=2994561 RepID=A0A9J6ZDB0_9BACL|nr:MAG: glycosyltransferase family 2 protein [Candidatus Pristimantibacillus lignocellulolyticus]